MNDEYSKGVRVEVFRGAYYSPSDVTLSNGIRFVTIVGPEVREDLALDAPTDDAPAVHVVWRARTPVLEPVEGHADLAGPFASGAVAFGTLNSRFQALTSHLGVPGQPLPINDRFDTWDAYYALSV